MHERILETLLGLRDNRSVVEGPVAVLICEEIAAAVLHDSLKRHALEAQHMRTDKSIHSRQLSAE